MSDDLQEKLPLKELLSLPAGKYLATAVAVAILLATIILALRLDDIGGPGGLEFKFRQPNPALAAKP
jgi:hypothetical protein